MSKDLMCRKWQLTFNNPEKHGISSEGIRETVGGLKTDYCCMGDHIGEEGTYHNHTYIIRKSPIRFSTLKKLFPTAHLEPCQGTSQQNRDYIRKEGKHLNKKNDGKFLPETFWESGECPVEMPGRRTDREVLYDMIKNGMSDIEIMEQDPRYLNDLDKIDRARQILIEDKYKNVFRLLETKYIWGETGTGKTRAIMEKYGYINVYRVTDYIHPWDSYKQQPVVVFEEFHSSIRIMDMLNYLDGYPLDLPCRYVNKKACYEKVFILSNRPLEDQYTNIQKDSFNTWEAFLRRIHEVIEADHSTFKTTTEYKTDDISSRVPEQKPQESFNAERI